MEVKKQYLVFVDGSWQMLYLTVSDQYFIASGEGLVFIPDFAAERLINMFVHVEHHEK